MPREAPVMSATLPFIEFVMGDKIATFICKINLFCHAKRVACCVRRENTPDSVRRTLNGF